MKNILGVFVIFLCEKNLKLNVGQQLDLHNIVPFV